MAAPDDPPELAALTSQFESKTTEYSKERDRQVADGLARYRERVATAFQQAQASGNFESSMRLREEGKRVEGDSVDLAELEKHEVPEVANLRAALREVIDSAHRRHNEQMTTLIRQYLRPLERLKPQFVTRGDLESAERVSNEIARVTKELANLSTAASGGIVKLPAALERGLVARFGFDRDEGTQIIDSSGNGFSGTSQSASWVEWGKLGGAFAFDGVNDQIALMKKLPDSKELTISVWLRYQGQGGDGGIFSDWGPAGGNDLFFSLLGRGGVHIRADKDGKKLASNLSLGKDLTEEWHHLVWSMGSSESVVFLDGKEVAKTREGGSNIGHHGAAIGSAHDGARQTRFLGLLDEIMIWSRALGAKEVAELHALQQ